MGLKVKCIFSTLNLLSETDVVSGPFFQCLEIPEVVVRVVGLKLAYFWLQFMSMVGATLVFYLD